MRRRITNRESAHRMRMKRQEELETHQRQVRRPAPDVGPRHQPHVLVWPGAPCVRDAEWSAATHDPPSLRHLCLHQHGSSSKQRLGGAGRLTAVTTPPGPHQLQLAALQDAYNAHTSSSPPSACMSSCGQSHRGVAACGKWGASPSFLRDCDTPATTQHGSIASQAEHVAAVGRAVSRLHARAWLVLQWGLLARCLSQQSRVTPYGPLWA